MAEQVILNLNGDEAAQTLDAITKTYKNTNLLEIAKAEVRAALLQAVQGAVNAGTLPPATPAEFVIEEPADHNHGDLAANIALVSAKTFGMAPRKIADAILLHIPADGIIDRVEIAGPGFINIFLSTAYFSSVVMAACTQKENYGRTNYGQGQKINVEFVSANPTGPMHLGNARGGALGDVFAESLSWAGYDVTREFYINDAGNQVVKFGRSLAARFLQIVKGEDAIEFPEDGYQGEDIKERAQEFYDLNGAEWAEKPMEELEEALVHYALPKNIESLKTDLEKYRIHYDVWFHESTLHQSGAVDAAIEKLRQRDAIYESEGAIWYKATAFGGEKDEVLVRANGIPTYFAADIAYHADKFARGFDKSIDIWGADHHGHVARIKGAMDAIGLDGSKLEVVLMQFVSLVRDGQQVRMSKRTGKAITLSDLLEEVPIDSARFFFNMREPGSQIEFDLGLAVAQDSENPVYYVQYAHARICSIIKALAAENVSFTPMEAFAHLNLLTAPEERALIRQISAFPGEIINATKNNNPAGITRAAVDTATLFHKFYTACRVKVDDEKLLQARLALCIATKYVLNNCLSMLKVTTPEQM